MPMNRARRLIAGVAALTAALALSACGGSSETPAAAAPPAVTPIAATEPRFNAADVTFAQRMIPHHRDALSMATLAVDQASDKDVKALARAIFAAQDPEIGTMEGWLRDWGKEIPVDHAKMNMQGTAMADLPALKAAKGKAFDRLFLKLMTQHHEGAITDAKAERKAGLSPDARALAADIAKAQTAEIARMKKLG